MKSIFAYICLIVIINIGFQYLPPIDIGFGLFAPMSIAAGAVFVARDYAQRNAGQWVWLAMLSGCALSYLMADPYIALASMLSFAISEFVDWTMFTFSDRPFHQRVLISSFIATPIDTIVFLTLIDLFTQGTFVLMTLSKLIVAIGIYFHGTKSSVAKRA